MELQHYDFHHITVMLIWLSVISFVKISWKISWQCCIVIFDETFTAATFLALFFIKIDFDLNLGFFIPFAEFFSPIC